ncbi:MAG: DUF1801 domain-containing protein [Candidatus Kerfeldbacteria bacterium]|nr:DUF1801 domain-containing protein [Candidatus Kerfeldbacteria bacterium]
MGRVSTVNQYIAAAPAAARPMLKQIRAAIRHAAPQAKESISYRMPYYSYHGRLAYFAAFRDHVSYFIIPERAMTSAFAAVLKPYRTSKSTLRIPLGAQIPTGLIKRVVKAQIRLNAARAKK